MTASSLLTRPAKLALALMISTALLWSFTAPAAEPLGTTSDSARGLIQRIVPKQAGQFLVEIILADSGHDVFEVESVGGKIVLRGNDAVSIASALNWYLKNECHCDISWHCGDQLNLPKPLPALPSKIRVVSPNQYRYAYNFCTYGYTMVWWHWPDWERELDFLALNGINLALVIEGQEAAWVDTFTNFGYSPARLRAWVVDPAHLPWMEMDNMEDYGGPLSPELINGRLELGQKIITRMRELGIEPVLPGYYGMVPPDFRTNFPAANVHLQGNWANLKRPDILDPTDPMFAKVAAVYYSAQDNLFGGAHFYDADPFHEGGTTDHIDIPAGGVAIQKAMNGATWVLQSWGKNPHQEMVDPLDKDKVLVLDLFCEDHENWRLRNNFNGMPWVWSAINCFGGNLKFGGRLAWMSTGPDASLTDPVCGRRSGVGAALEASGVNPVLWETLLDTAWDANAPYLDSWLNDYTRRRYGAKIPAAEQAWKIFAETVYNEPPPGATHTIKPIICSAPQFDLPGISNSTPTIAGMRPVTKPHYNAARLVEGWRLLLSAAPEAKSSDGYRFDLCDVTRQVLVDLGTRYNEQISVAYKTGDAAKLRTMSNKMLGLIRDMDELAGTRYEWLLGTWLADARSWGATTAEKDLCEHNARELLTTWTRYDNIPDYANRQWNGLLGEFYYHRWSMWLTALNNSLAHGVAFDEMSTRNQIREWEIAWSQQTSGHFPTKPHGDSIAIAKRLFEKYSRDAAQSDVILKQP